MVQSSGLAYLPEVRLLDVDGLVEGHFVKTTALISWKVGHKDLQRLGRKRV